MLLSIFLQTFGFNCNRLVIDCFMENGIYSPYNIKVFDLI